LTAHLRIGVKPTRRKRSPRYGRIQNSPRNAHLAKLRTRIGAQPRPVAIELIHNVARPIRTLDELNREQQRIDRAREKLLAK
jgi:hypothetical protein